MADFDIQRPAGQCAVTGRAFAEGEEFYTVILDDGTSLTRMDYALSEWSGAPEGAFCCFRSRMPAREKKRRLLVDDDLLVHFFLRLAEETEPRKVRFRFVLALILMRKRLLKYEDSRRENDVETWTMKLARDGTLHGVVNPKLTDDQVAEVSDELNAILHGDVVALLDYGEQASSETGADDCPDPRPEPAEPVR